MDSKSRKLLIVERKLISNRGHHHTQIGALKSLFPASEIHILAGEGYDGFLGKAAGTIASENFRFARLSAKSKQGPLTQRVAAHFSSILKGRFRLPKSAYGEKLIEICGRLSLAKTDIIVVPTADIDSLESSLELAKYLGDKAPMIALRFLSPTMGEKSGRLLQSRLQHCIEQLTANVRLFTETEELASYFRDRYALDAASGFFMPCSLGFSDFETEMKRAAAPFRVGVFGAPRREKGSERIAPIVRAVAERLDKVTHTEIEFAVQGAAEDFSEAGIYKELRKFLNAQGVSVLAVSDLLSPMEFEKLFKSVDVVLMPYDVDVYGLQGSGVIQDAVAALKPIVYSRGMSMVSFLKHGNAVAATSDDEFAKALIDVAGDSGQFFDGAVEASKFFQNIITNLSARFTR